MIIIDEMINKRYFPGNISDYPLRISSKDFVFFEKFV